MPFHALPEETMVQKLFCLFVAFFLSAAASAGTAINATPEGIALGGYDPVAYFTKKAPTKGDPQYVHEWSGAKWYFASAEHRDLFKETPEKYAPQYGGHCAYAVGARGSISRKAPTGEYWEMYRGKVYLFPDAKSGSDWYARGQVRMIEWGDEAWPALKARLEAR
jgi:YHS domain-containing protein